MDLKEALAKAEELLKDWDTVEVTGKINIYMCPKCSKAQTTINLAEGVTPFMISCNNCDELARSTLYPDLELVPPHMRVPTHEWYRPEVTEDVDPRELEHISNGGLLLREVSDGKED